MSRPPFMPLDLVLTVSAVKCQLLSALKKNKITSFTYNNHEVIIMTEHDNNFKHEQPEEKRKYKQGTSGAAQWAWQNKLYSEEIPISSAYPVIDSDLARDNIENDIPAADLQDI